MYNGEYGDEFAMRKWEEGPETNPMVTGKWDCRK